MTGAPRIEVATRVGELLDAHPELEDVLVSLSPAFEKLRHPMLRKTVARVATLESAARVAGVDVAELITALRRALGAEHVGSPPDASASAPSGGACSEHEHAALLDAPVAETIDADAVLEAGEHPAAVVERALRAAPGGSVVVLEASFRPEPLVERLVERGNDLHVDGSAGDHARIRVLIRARKRGTT